MSIPLVLEQFSMPVRASATAMPTSEGSIYFEGQTSVDPMNAVVGDFYSKDWNEPFSVFFWFKGGISAASQNGAFFDKTTDDATAQGWKVGFYAGNIDFTMTSDANSGIQMGVVIAAIDDASWHHYCFTYEGDADPSNITAYIDGIAVGKTVYVNNLGMNTTTSSADLIIGAYGSNGYASLNGYISEAGISTGVLDATQVYDTFLGTYTNLEALWIARDNDSTTMLEAKNGVNNATINGGVWSADSP